MGYCELSPESAGVPGLGNGTCKHTSSLNVGTIETTLTISTSFAGNARSHYTTCLTRIA
jgi:hypothetical protein